MVAVAQQDYADAPADQEEKPFKTSDTNNEGSVRKHVVFFVLAAIFRLLCNVFAGLSEFLLACSSMPLSSLGNMDFDAL